MDRQMNLVETTTEHMDGRAEQNPAPEVTRLRTDIEDARDGLGYYVSDLHRRRNPAQRTLGIAAGVATVAAAVGAIGLVARSRRLRGFLLGAAVPVALKVARGVVERPVSRQPRLA